MTIRFYLFNICVLLYFSIHSGRAASDKGGRKPLRQSRNRWTTEQEKKLIFFDVLTDDGEKFKLERIRALWHNEYPNSNVTGEALYKRILQLRKDSQEEGERARYFKWDHEKKTELLTIYYNTKPYKTDAERSLEEEWGRRYKDFPFSGRTLAQQARRILEERGKKPEDPAEGIPNADLEWHKQQDSDLIHVRNVARLEGQTNTKYIHGIWAVLYPEFSHVTLHQLREHIKHLKNNPPNENFPWTEEENKELLDIYDKTMPNEEDQGQRIYDIWSKIHPRYKFMTPFYLQIHASTLAHKRELAGTGGSTRRNWTHGEKTYLLSSYYQHSGDRGKVYEFHKEWVRKYPRLAHRTNKALKTYALTLERRGFNVTSETFAEGSSGRKDSESRLQHKQERHKGYGETSTMNRKQSKRLMIRSEGEHETNNPMKFRSVNKLMRNSKEEKSEKRFGKAKVVYHSDEQESSPSNMSEYSE